MSSANVGIWAIGLASPATAYSQAEVLRRLSIIRPELRRFFEHQHIERRHLILPPDGQEESTGQLLVKFKENALGLGSLAIEDCLRQAKLEITQVDFLVCVSSTGFLTPGLSAHYLKQLGLRPDCQRLDIVGMGCNAGLNGLGAATSWCSANPGKKALLVCAEICSAIYSVDDSTRTALVNSLFGDGVGAALLSTQAPMSLLGFESEMLPDHIGSLRFDWDDEKHRHSFYVGRETPRVLAAAVEKPFTRLLSRHGLKREQVRHWVVHTGGAAILEGIQQKLKLSREDLRHSWGVLKDFGNLSSASFLFSYSALLQEGKIKNGDYGVIMTMGPGLTIETALVRWGADA